MTDSVKRLAIIPARSGSKRIPNKNIKPFLGKPIISYAIESATKSGLFDKIHVSTDSERAMVIAESYGIKPEFLRDEALCDDYTPLIDVLAFVREKLEQMGEKFDEIWLMMPCAPLITENDLVAAAEKFQPNNLPLIAAAELPVPIEWAFMMSDDGTLCAKGTDNLTNRSQDLPKAYYDTGSFAIFSDGKMETFKNIHTRFQTYILPRSRAVDIDTEDDWIEAEKLYKANFHKL